MIPKFQVQYSHIQTRLVVASRVDSYSYGRAARNPTDANLEETRPHTRDYEVDPSSANLCRASIDDDF